MKIGILTFHSANNYGAILQCYALQRFLIDSGYECYVVDYRPPYYGLQPIDLKSLWCKNPVRYFLRCLYTLLYRPKVLLRNKSFSTFIKCYIKLAPADVLKDNNSNFNAFVYGSDQIWDYDICKGYDNVFFAGFPAAAGAKNISYAASLGSYDLTNDKKDGLAKLLINYSRISVREEELSRLTENLGFSSAVVLDPTLLYPNSFDCVDVGEKRLKEDYVLVYEMAHCDGIMACAEHVARQINVNKIIRIEKDDVMGPVRFLNLFRYASCVITTSFHGVAFSIIYKKPFYSLSVGSFADIRMKSLLQKLNIASRIISSDQHVVYGDIDCNNVYKLLGTLQEESARFLKEALK